MDLLKSFAPFLLIFECIEQVTTKCFESKQTMVPVARCPRNKLEWDARAAVFNCSSFNQSCGETESLYHCALDENISKLIEVCAPYRNIHGRKCIEFDAKGDLIQESKYNCSIASVPCPEAYKSTDAFNYF